MQGWGGETDEAGALKERLKVGIEIKKVSRYAASREQPLPPCHRRGTNEGVGQLGTAEASPRHTHHSEPLSAVPNP